MGKSKTENSTATAEFGTDPTSDNTEKVNGEDQLSYEQKLVFVNAIAQPMASKKTVVRISKLINKAQKYKTPNQKPFMHMGLKNVQTRIRKGDKGIVIFAGDVSPVDLICHLPGVCEEKGLPYIYVPGRRDIGAAMGKTSGSLVVLILHNSEYDEDYNKVVKDIKKSSKPLDE